MKHVRSICAACAAAVCMLVLILDTPTALQGARDGLELCLNTIVPSLFPFFVLSALLTASISAFQLRILRPLGRLCRIPAGCETLLLIGLAGGYPVGAQCIAQCHAENKISTRDARRLLGFCSNAGPAFLFGVVSGQFSDGWYVWSLWGIHVVCAILSGILLSGKAEQTATPVASAPLTLSQALDRGLKTTARVCGWVILFRVILAFLQRWFLWRLPVFGQVAVSGFLELSNGCCDLGQIGSEGARFVLCAVMLSFGGICVAMQTASVTAKLGLGAYIPGKLLQATLSFQFSYQLQRFTFPPSQQLHLPGELIFFIWFCLLIVKISVAFPRVMMYNPVKT